MNSQPQHLPSPEKTLYKQKRKKEKEIDSLQFSLMNVEFPISILITPVRRSAVYKIKKKTHNMSLHINS